MSLNRSFTLVYGNSPEDVELDGKFAGKSWRSRVMGFGHPGIVQGELHYPENLRNRFRVHVIGVGIAWSLIPEIRLGDVVVDGWDWLQDVLWGPCQDVALEKGTFHVYRAKLGRIEHPWLIRAQEVPQAAAIDMESEGLISNCREYQTPCAVMKFIVGSNHQEAPADFKALLDETRANGREILRRFLSKIETR